MRPSAASLAHIAAFFRLAFFGRAAKRTLARSPMPLRVMPPCAG